MSESILYIETPNGETYGVGPTKISQLENDSGFTTFNDLNNNPRVTNAITSWLDENLTGDSSIAIDSSLTTANAAADAKATGDRFKALEDASIETDATLTQEGAAADAKAVGTIFEEIGAMHDTVIQFESGSYSETTPVDRSDRARTTDYVAVSAGDVLKQYAKEYEWWMFVFNEQKTLVSQSSAFASGDHTFDANGYFRLAVKRMDGGNITEAEIEALSAGDFMIPRRTAIPVVDNSLTKAGAAADAKETGDRIKAIREEMQGLGVNDGIRYLLIEVLRNCLMSKDQSAMIDDLNSAMCGENGITKSGQTLSIRYLLNDTVAKSDSILIIQ